MFKTSSVSQMFYITLYYNKLLSSLQQLLTSFLKLQEAVKTTVNVMFMVFVLLMHN